MREINEDSFYDIQHDDILNERLTELNVDEVEFYKALNKQIPKKSTYHHKANGECALTICPNCENRLTVDSCMFPLDRYCKKCGQHYIANKLDWSVEEQNKDYANQTTI